ncbi:MAG TPA: beta-ketoacyl synthase N-terminal-like domain-containing protein [Actinokineospora sp.]|nr:beta-ketoacyl synthase N-terminal-like domain-containing protein [Actinokineospora sp.]
MTERRTIAVVGVHPLADAVASGLGTARVLRVRESEMDIWSERGDVDVLVLILTDDPQALGHACRTTAAIAQQPNRPGSIVLVSSTSTGQADGWQDAAAVAAVRAATERLAADSMPVRVNAVAAVAAGEAEAEIVHAVAYLAGVNAALLTGQCVTVDGSLAPHRPRAAVVAEAEYPEAADDSVVVVGMGVALPGASSPDELWGLLRGDKPVFGEPGDRIDLTSVWSADPSAPDRSYSRVSGFMTDFRPHPSLPPATDGRPDEYTATWLRHSIAQATEHVHTRAGDRHLFAVGLTADGSHHLEQSIVVGEVRRLLGDFDAATDARLRDFYPLAVDDPEQVLPYRIARQAAVDLPGDTEIVVLDTACSSSLYSVDLGVRALRSGSADLALCGGAFALSVQNLVLFGKLRGLSRSGSVRPLDRTTDGVLFSDGAAVLALKTFARARADGDQVLGFIAGFGASSDGRGKAIYAPNAAGQSIALSRAWSQAGVAPADIDWVIAHATGTPTGDRTELSVLADAAEPGKTWTVSSNKGLIGHTGWAAGAVSAVHALLALRHQIIPAQPGFTELPAGIDPTAVSVPTDDVAWPSGRDRARTVAVSAMGFGGTNAHLLLTDTPPDAGDAPTSAADPVVITDWAAHFPSDPEPSEILRWLDGTAPAWPASFGEHYPLPSPVDLRLAPSAIAAMDRSQLMAIRCADQLAGDWVTDRDLADRTGVFVGHTGPTRAAVRHDTRCYLADLTAKIGPAVAGFEQRVAEPVRAAIAPATEDSYPGLMPNIIPARIAQRLDLHGPNMAFDAGLDSFNSALACATRYLRDGEIDVAVVIGVAAAAEHVVRRDGREPAEAAIGVVVTRNSIAEAKALPVLAHLDTAPGAAAAVAPGDRVHHGAEGAVALLRALHQPGRTVVAAQEDSHTPGIVVTVPGSDSALRKVMRRHALVLRPRPAHRVGDAAPAIPPGSVIVTDVPVARTGSMTAGPSRCSCWTATAARCPDRWSACSPAWCAAWSRNCPTVLASYSSPTPRKWRRGSPNSPRRRRTTGSFPRPTYARDRGLSCCSSRSIRLTPMARSACPPTR